jgi:hypothetical protein
MNHLGSYAISIELELSHWLNAVATCVEPQARAGAFGDGEASRVLEQLISQPAAAQLNRRPGHYDFLAVKFLNKRSSPRSGFVSRQLGVCFIASSCPRSRAISTFAW